MINIKQIRDIVENNVGFNLEVRSRKRHHSDARAIFYKLCREYTNDTFVTIGEELNKNYATVVHGVHKIFPVVDQVLYTSIKQQINNSGRRAIGIKALNTIASIEYGVNWSDLNEEQLEFIQQNYFLQK
jgi:chromosomal replication initiation ATPase DnaA